MEGALFIVRFTKNNTLPTLELKMFDYEGSGTSARIHLKFT